MSQKAKNDGYKIIGKVRQEAKKSIECSKRSRRVEVMLKES